MKMKIDVRSEKSLYIEIGGWTFYIDDSTNEQIMSKWETITGDSDTDELLEDEKMAQEDPLERFIDCPQCHEESGCYVRKNSFKECKHCGYYNNEDGKVSCDICGKKDNVTEHKDFNSGNFYNICNNEKCYVIVKGECEECWGDGFLEYDESQKKDGEVIEFYGTEECKKCNGKGIIE